ncbi:hypothetical protein [Bacillus cereus]|uniref:hypothetical protein n=1 Tax=Bacillus cereus TaxID=1396 RepID=UPI001F167CAA|nr:hypothetical protein [Bacillus cereus]
MVSYKRMLIEVDTIPDTEDGRKQADFLSKLKEAVTREEQSHVPYKSLDVVAERLEDDSYRCTPNKLLQS